MDNTIHIYILVALAGILLYVCIRYPEVSFSLFIWAGIFKGDPLIEPVNNLIDLTLLFAVITLFGVGIRMLSMGGATIKQIKIYPKMLVPYTILCFMMLLSLTYTKSPIYGLDKSVKFVTLGSLSIFLPLLLFVRKEAIDRFYQVTIILSAVLGLQIIVALATRNLVTAYEGQGVTYIAASRIGGVAIIAILLYFVRTRTDMSRKALYWILTPFAFFSIFTPGGRGPIIALAFSLVFIAIYIILRLPRDQRILMDVPKRFRFSVAVAVITFFIISVVLIFNLPGYFYRSEVRLERLFGEERSMSLDPRTERIGVALDCMYDFPSSLRGLGAGGFNVAYGKADAERGEYPHNIFFEIGSELGMIALIAFIYLIIEALRVAFSNIRNAKRKDQFFISVIMLTMLIFMIVNSSVSGDINDNRFLFVLIGTVFALQDPSIFQQDSCGFAS